MTHQFKILGIKPTRDIRAIKKAYRAKALLLHPDHGGNPNMFRELTSAYEYLLKNAKTMMFEPVSEPVYSQPVKPPPEPPPPPPTPKIFRTIHAKQLMDDTFYSVVEIPQYLRDEDFILFINWETRGAFKIPVSKKRMGTTTKLEIFGVILTLQLTFSNHLFESTQQFQGKSLRNYL